jgi:hypothetical protein
MARMAELVEQTYNTLLVDELTDAITDPQDRWEIVCSSAQLPSFLPPASNKEVQPQCRDSSTIPHLINHSPSGVDNHLRLVTVDVMAALLSDDLRAVG